MTKQVFYENAITSYVMYEKQSFKSEYVNIIMSGVGFLNR